MSETRPIYHPSAETPPLEALVVDRERLVRVLRIALAELHSRRLITPGFTGEYDIIGMIRYWDTVFAWIKEQQADELVLISRRMIDRS